ncbi:MAG: ABC transporter ATP-binding protein [SAR202 cluster bacterium]|nr:ABC transporter ATP-binding protein [SAR202 cluster bacterium]
MPTPTSHLQQDHANDMESTAVISARNVTKRYDQLTAVDGISFDIRRGECFGFLGPNGAGKTTTMKMISCISPVTEGELRVDGRDVRREQRAIKSALGVVSQADSLDPDLNVIQNLLAFGRFFNLPRETARKRAWDALELFQLRDKAYQRPDELSGGMRRRLLIARALLHEPSILVLDEPTTGLDPQTRLMMWEKLRQLKTQGITILLTTHYMDEATYLCDRLVVIDAGKILVEGSPRELISRHAGGQVVQVQVALDRKEGLAETLRGRGLEVEDRGDMLFLYGEDGALSNNGAALQEYQVVKRPGNLEDVFLRLTGRGLRDE